MATPHRHGILHRERKIVGTAEHAGNFSTLVSAIRTAGLESALDGTGPFTLFAPTDAAFRKLPAGSLENLTNDRSRLTSFLKSHVVPGTVMAKDSFSTKSVKTLEGRDINFDTCDEFKVNGAKVVMPDIECRNGVLHGVDSVLVPVEPPAVTTAAAVPAAPAPAPAATTTATCACPACGEQVTGTTSAEAERKLAEHEKMQHKETVVKEKVTEKAPAAAQGKCPPGYREKVVEKPKAKTVERVVEKERVAERPIAQCTTCGEKISGTSAEETKRKLVEHEKIHKESAAKPKGAATAQVHKTEEKAVPPSCECTTCGEQVTGTTSAEAERKLAEHERVEHKGVRGTLREGTEKMREGAREGTESMREGARETSGTRERESGSVSGKVKESTSNVTGRTGAAAAGAAGTIGAGAGAVAGGAKGLLGRAGDAIRGKSGQYSLRCPECGEEITGATREEAQANLTEHGKAHLK